ncbi:MAG: arginase [Cyclobacteriaceae bacterium]
MKELIIIEVKSEIGAGTRGASLGIEAVKIASLDLGSDLFRTHPSIEVEHVNELLFNSAEHAYAKFIDGVLIMEERVCLEVYEQLFEEKFPVVMAGDHSTAYGTIAGIKKAYPKKRLGVVWIDAHADLHSPYTTPSGNMHGMTLAMACDFDNLECKVNQPRGETLEYWEQIQQVGTPGAKINPEDIVFVSVRDLEKAENYLINKYGMNFIEVEDVRKKGPEAAAAKALKMLDHCDLIYISFDVDSIDSRFSSGTGTPVPNGLNPEEVRILNTELVKDPRVCAWEIAEVNPTLDTENKMSETAFEVIRSVTGAIVSREA